MSMTMPTVDNCPHCGYNLIGGRIADRLGEAMTREYYGNPDAHWRKEIGVEVSEIYDGTLYYQCPECSGTWHRWSKGSGFHEKAEQYIHGGV